MIIAKLALAGEGTVLRKESLHPAKSIARVAYKLARLEKILAAMRSRVLRVFPEEVEMSAVIEQPRKVIGDSVRILRNCLATRIDSKLALLLASIPGVGPTLAATFIAEIGSINQFPSGKALVAYAGLDPRVRQSGISLRRNTKLTKRGSPYLRKAAYIAAYIAKRHDAELGTYHAKKILEGKRYKEATVATARKILYRVYAVWKRGTPYQKHTLSTTIA